MALVIVGSLLVQVPAVEQVAAAPPKATACQHGLFGKTAPKVQAACTSSIAPLVTSLPTGFQETTVWSGLTNPTAIRFAADGRVFVAEKSGTIKIFDNLTDTTPTVFTTLVPLVHNYWDRGLLGMALDPSLTGGAGNGSYLYVLYSYDHILGSSTAAPQWGDACPTPPGPTTDGCVISARLSKFAVSGTTITGSEQVLVEDWCQQFPSHSIGSLVFGPDGALYVSAGDGANFNASDYGQWGGTSGSPPVTQINPCGDPPGGSMTPPTAEGGALRSQDVRSAGTSTSYASLVAADGAIGYWRLGESGTTAAADSVGSNTGTYVGGYTQGAAGALTGDSNTAATFNGSTGYVALPSTIDTAGRTQVSVEAWFKLSGTPSGDARIVANSHTDSDRKGVQLWLNGASQINFAVGIGTIYAGASYATPLSVGTWYHVVGTYDGSVPKLYVNGLKQGEGGLNAGTIQSSGFPLNIGRNPAYAGDFFPGTIDEVAVYPTALSALQASAHYQAASGSGGSTDPTGLDGAILRLDPVTGAGKAGNPFASSSDPNSRRIIAYGLRNPFRITPRPGTNELWVGDVGWSTWEEINRIPNMTDGVAENFGWPCYEGGDRTGAYDADNLNLCESLYAQGSGAIAGPYYTYNHAAQVVSGESCPTGSSSITGMAFYPESGGSYPASYAGGLFFADHSRNCIWFMPKGANGQPNPAAVQTFVAPAAGPVDLQIGPGGDLFYVDFDGGTIRRISATGSNQPPTAVIQATPTSGPAPLTVQFNGSGSSDPEGTALTYAWDLDGDGQFNDATGATASRTYQSPGNVTVGLRVTDAGNATGTATQVISVGNSPPVPVISTPTSALHWKVGDLISFSGSATDAQDGTLPASALSWTLILHHCPSNCHTHFIQSWTGVSSGSVTAPDHQYPSWLELTLTATDSLGTTASTTVRLDPTTVGLTFQSAPSGLSLGVNTAAVTTPFVCTVIVASQNTVSATSPQTLNGLTYSFSSWSDGGSQAHTIVAPATATTYTATYTTTSRSFVTTADSQIRSSKPNTNFGTSTSLTVRPNQYRSYLKFVVTGLSGAPSAAKVRVWVTDPSSNRGSIYLVGNSWTETGITWANAPPIAGSTLASGGNAALGTWVEFNVRPAITGNGTYTFAISGGSTDAVTYASRETANDPVLVVTP